MALTPGAEPLEGGRRPGRLQLGRPRRGISGGAGGRDAGKGPSALYTGEIAEAIIASQLATQSGNPDGVGRMTLEDLASYFVGGREPVEGTYRGYRIVGMPPPSSGGLTSIQILKILERFPIGDESQGFGFGFMWSVINMTITSSTMRW